MATETITEHTSPGKIQEQYDRYKEMSCDILLKAEEAPSCHKLLHLGITKMAWVSNLKYLVHFLQEDFRQVTYGSDSLISIVGFKVFPAFYVLRYHDTPAIHWR